MLQRLALCTLIALLACDPGKAPTDTGPAADPCAAAEVCNGLDDDCDGLVDDDDPSVDPDSMPSWYEDVDGDGYGPGRTEVVACSSPYASGANEDGDCQADDPAVNPGAEELCDGLDNDCDGLTDVGMAEGVALYEDHDRDGFGVGESTTGCEGVIGYAVQAGDCDDEDPESYPEAPEYCWDEVDQDCDGAADGSCPVELCGEIDEDTTIEENGVGYYVTCDIDVSATLTVEPGVVLYFAPTTGLEVGSSGAGALDIDAESDPVRFTSAAAVHDPYGVPARGDWRGVRLSTGAEGVDLRGLHIEYAGGADETGDTSDAAALTLSGGPASLQGGLVRSSAGYGVRTSGETELTIIGSTFGDNAEVSVYLPDEAPPPTIISSAFEASDDFPISLVAAQTVRLDTSNIFLEDTDAGYVEIRGGPINQSVEIPAISGAYAVTGTLAVAGEDEPVLTLADGVTMHFDFGAGLEIGDSAAAGGLSVDADSGVTLDALKGSGWDGVVITQLPDGTLLRGLTIRDGGNSGQGALRLEGTEGSSSARLTDCTIDGSSGHGLSIGCDVKLSITHSTFTGSGGTGVYFNCGSRSELVATEDSEAFADNVLTENEYPISIPAPSLAALDESSSYTGNEVDRIVINGGKLTGSLTLSPLSVPYLLQSGLLVEGSDEPVLTISAGVDLDFSSGTLAVGQSEPGSLVIEGTEAAPVTLSCTTCDTDGVNWAGITLGLALGSASLSYVNVSDAETGLTVVTDAPIEISNSSFLDSATYDLYCPRGDDSVTWSGVTYETNEGCSPD